MAITKQQPAAAAQGQALHVSMDPETFGAGGLLDDVDVTISDIAWVVWAYPSGPTAGQQAPFLQVEFLPPDGKEHVESLKADSLEFFQPSADGEWLDMVIDPATGAAKKGKLPGQSNAGIFLTSLVTAASGMHAGAGDEMRNLLGAKPISALKGLQCHIHREIMKRTGKPLPGQEGKDNKVLVVDKIHVLPNGTAAAGVAAKAAGPRRAATAAQAPAQAPAVAVTQITPPSSDAAQATAELVFVIVASAGPGGVAKKDLPKKMYDMVPVKDAAYGEMVRLAYLDEFLKGVAGVKYEGGVLTLA
jgi:hypothetical protein